MTSVCLFFSNIHFITFLLDKVLHFFIYICYISILTKTILLKAILSLPSEKQKAVFSRAFKIESPQIDEVIDEMFEQFDEVEYKYNVEANYEDFLQLIDSAWADYLVSE